MSTRAFVPDFRLAFMWAIEMDGPQGPVNVAQFGKCTPPQQEIEEVTFKPAGSLVAVKRPGQIKVSDCTLERVLKSRAPDLGFWQWLQDAANNMTDTAKPASIVVRNFDILHLTEDGAVIERIKCYTAWPKIVKLSDLGGDSQPMMETVTLSVERFQRLPR